MNREEWLESLRKRGWSDSDISKARFAWNACEREVRTECAEICRRIAAVGKQVDDDEGSFVALHCADMIMETIKNG